MIETENDNIALTRQANLVGVNRTGIYRKEAEHKESEENIVLMHRIDVIHTEFPTYGYRFITRLLRNAGWPVNRKRVRRHYSHIESLRTPTATQKAGLYR